MDEFKLRRARLGAWVRYLNFPCLLWFASDVPMPVDKRLMIWIAGIKLAVNVVFHVHLHLTRRFRFSSYLMQIIEVVSTCVALYATGLAASPFLLLYPLFPFSAFYVDFNRRATLAFGGFSTAALVATYAVWWWQGAPPMVWNPAAYPNFVAVVCLIQVLILAAYMFLATETNPLVEELARREQVLLRQGHRAELGTSIAMIAHELRNPLTTIGLSLDRIGRVAAAPEADRRLPKAVRDASEELARITRMVQDLLAYARERRGRMEPSDHAPAKLVDRAVDFLRLKWGRNQRAFVVELDLAGAPEVRCDGDAMYQVLVNVMENAIQHPAPGRPLRLEIRHALRGGRVTIAVRDNGAGMSAERLARVFEGFVTDRREGTGLGMVISRQLMEDQQGGIEITSTEGAGTTVVLLLPPATGGSPAGASVPAAAPAPE